MKKILGVSKQWVVDERYPVCSIRSALTNYLDITSPVSQNILLYFSTQATDENDRIQLEKLAKVKPKKWENTFFNVCYLILFFLRII